MEAVTVGCFVFIIFIVQTIFPKTLILLTNIVHRCILLNAREIRSDNH